MYARATIILSRTFSGSISLRNAESVSRPLFATALELAANLRLTEPGPDLTERRAAFCQRLHEKLATLEMIETITRETMEA